MEFYGIIIFIVKKFYVALPEATPSPFGTATLRLAPSALAPLGLRSAAKCAPRRATNLVHKIILDIKNNNPIKFHRIPFCGIDFGESPKKLF